MDIEINPAVPDLQPPTPVVLTTNDSRATSVLYNGMLESLINEESLYLKSQQRNEPDPTRDEKIEILSKILTNSKLNFILRFGAHLKPEYLEYFKQFENNSEDGYGIKLQREALERLHSQKNRLVDIRNRRFAALQSLSETDYFSDREMMKRNPLLYEQYIGQYLSEREKQARVSACDEKTFVGVLMEGIDREYAETKKRTQLAAQPSPMEDDEGSESGDSDSSEDLPKQATSHWGEYSGAETSRATTSLLPTLVISTAEKLILRDEFVVLMHQSFLDGKDDEFDYSTVDNNDEYDNIEVITRDEQDKYFDSEEPEEIEMEQDTENPRNEDTSSSEDELDIYMSALNQNPTVAQLSKDMKKL